MDQHAERWEVVVVGAGAAGLLAALVAARGGRRVLLLEATKDGGRKILISGGGRCNILPSEATPERYVTDSSQHTLKKILRSWPLAEQIAFFEDELGQRLVKEPETGKLFPESNRARDVRDRLVARVRDAGASFRFGSKVRDIRSGSGSTWFVQATDGTEVEASTLILATGGCSVPATGSDGWGLDWVRHLGVKVNETYPALTPLIMEPPTHGHLAGVSLSVTVRVPTVRPRLTAKGGFLFTHRGYSGPTVLDVSHVAVRWPAADGHELRVQWTEATSDEWDQRLRAGAASVSTVVHREVPKRLAVQLIEECSIDPSTQVAQLSRAARKDLVDALSNYRLRWTGNEGYKKAEVTGGGIALSELHPKTLELRDHPGLFACGEILDAFGPIGGHNFLWAWATGRSAAEGALSRLASSQTPL